MIGEAGFEKVGIDDREDVRECLGSGDSVGDLDPFPEPVLLEFAEVLDVGEAVHTTEHRRDGHEENFAEIVAFVASGAGIFDDLEGVEMSW